MRIGVITDAHANLPATQAALAAMNEAACDQIIHLGDAIGIGPHPREVMEVMLSHKKITLLMGNHDQWFALGLPDPIPEWMTPGEALHHAWTHEQLSTTWKPVVAMWEMMVDLNLGNSWCRFQHYAMRQNEFAPICKGNAATDLDEIFRPETDYVFFGHHHPTADVQGRARYINPGALGCHPQLGARYALIHTEDGSDTHVTLHAVDYDPQPLYDDLEARRVPEKDIIRSIFYS